MAGRCGRCGGGYGLDGDRAVGAGVGLGGGTGGDAVVVATVCFVSIIIGAFTAVWTIYPGVDRCASDRAGLSDFGGCEFWVLVLVLADETLSGLDGGEFQFSFAGIGICFGLGGVGRSAAAVNGDRLGFGGGRDCVDQSPSRAVR